MCKDITNLIISTLKDADKCMLKNCCKNLYDIVKINKIIKLEKFIKHSSVNQFIYLEDTMNRENICQIAAVTGNLELLQYAYNNKYSYHSCDWKLVCKNGHFEILKWAFSENILKNRYCYTTYASQSQSKYSLKFNYPVQNIVHIMPNTLICEEAKKNNHLEILKWARENNFPEDKTNYNTYNDNYQQFIA